MLFDYEFIVLHLSRGIEQRHFTRSRQFKLEALYSVIHILRDLAEGAAGDSLLKRHALEKSYCEVNLLLHFP